MNPVAGLPVGTITFLFTDIEGSTRLLERLGDGAYAATLARHDAIVGGAVADAGGIVVHTIGDAFFAVFTEARAGLTAAVEAQRMLVREPWGEEAEIRVRMGLHTGTGRLGVGTDYVGIDVHRAARIGDAAHGGQIVISAATAALVEHALVDGITLHDLGQHELRDVSSPEHLFQVEVAGLPTSFPRLRTRASGAGELPPVLTSFIGRTEEIRQATELLVDAPLLTLTGPGGTGKTRLALAVAQELGPRFVGGAHFVPLESITDPALVVASILDVVGTKPRPGDPPEDHLIRWLSSRPSLLVLDNLEQVLAAAPVVGDLAARAGESRIIVTSRAPLHVRGERELPVPPLAAGVGDDAEPGAVADAVRLFVERAGAVEPGFELTPANAGAVATLTRELDGLPLAIELAASRVKLLPVEAIVERLSNRLLTQQSADLPNRQKTITGAIGWSYDLLEPAPRALFERCSVFVGDARIDEIEAICGPPEELGSDVLDALAVLVDQSLLQRLGSGGEPRFHMLNVVREFAMAALVARGDDDLIRRRHARVYAELASRASPHLLTSHHETWRSRLAADHDNLRAAVEWAVAHDDGDLACHLVADLWRFWQTQGHLAEARDRVAAALGIAGSSPLARARALEAEAGIRYWQGDWEGARRPYEEALALMRTHGDRADVANALYNAAFGVGYAREYDAALAMLAEALDIFESLGDRAGVGKVLFGLADIASYRSDYAGVIEHATRAVAELDEVDAPFDAAWSHFMVAHAHYFVGEPDKSVAYLQRALPFFLETRDLSALVLVFHLGAAVLSARGDDANGLLLLAAAEGLAERIGALISNVDVNRYPDVQRLRQGRATDDVSGDASALSTEDAIALVLEMAVDP